MLSRKMNQIQVAQSALYLVLMGRLQPWGSTPMTQFTYSRRRTLAAWCVIKAAERAIAKQLDYGDLHNYRPNTDFYSSGFDEEATQWVSSASAYDDLAEFNICAFVGSPARPQLIFKLQSPDRPPA